jgi:phospholipid/cholesterol/gamma-HCH transport system substrate-binding protein
MPRTRSLAWSELKIGIAGVVALALLASVILAVGGEGGYFWQRYPLKARFDNVMGLKEGAVVRLSGKEIGSVMAVEFSGAQVEVHFEVLNELRSVLTTESEAVIGSLSLLGEPIIDISTAGGGGTPLEDWAYVRTRHSSGPIGDVTTAASDTLAEIDRVLVQVRSGEGTLGRILTDDALYNEMQAFMRAAANVTRSLEAGQGTLGGLLKDPAAYQSMKSSLDNLQVMTTRINQGQGALGRLLSDDAMGQSLATATENVAQVTGRLTRGEGTAGKLLTDQQLYDRLNGMADTMNELTSGLKAGQGTAGQLLHDQQLYENMNRAAVELRDLLAEIRKDPRKYLRVNVSIF